MGPSATDVSATTVYQWYLGDPATGGIALSDDATYTGTTAATLGIVSDITLNGNEYCLVVTHPDNVCFTTTACATLTVVDPCDPIASGNPDNDSDGVSDVCDLDDDNDGLVDTLECGDEANWTTAAGGNSIDNNGLVTSNIIVSTGSPSSGDLYAIREDTNGTVTIAFDQPVNDLVLFFSSVFYNNAGDQN